MISGIFNITKPRGLTSFAVVRKVRHMTGIRKVGHAGTLDPIAEGVLPICIGSATGHIAEPHAAQEETEHPCIPRKRRGGFRAELQVRQKIDLVCV